MPRKRENTLEQTGVVTSLTRSRAVARAWHCRIQSDRDEGRTASIGARPVVIGGAADCDIALPDPAVSRRHAQLQVVTGGIRILDLGSTNGTFIGSSRVSDIVVTSSTTIRVGDSTLLLSPVSIPTIAPSRRRQFGGLIGDSLAMRELFAVLDLASPTDATVLIEGESGTGKEVAARSIHDHSSRCQEPFVVVDCGATQEEFVQSQLFGHVRGAFTGAVADRKGAFIEANKGTVFLDEIGELSLATQARLLRVLEASTIQPLGSDQTIHVDTRIIAATNRNLQQMVDQKTFRFDLFHRLAVVYIRLPALRERPEDLPALIRHFFKERGQTTGTIGGENLKLLSRYDWPGNVRELRNTLERAWVLAGSTEATFENLRISLQSSGFDGLDPVDPALTFREARERFNGAFERRYLTALRELVGNNISRMARQAGLSRVHLRKLLKKHGLA